MAFAVGGEEGGAGSVGLGSMGTYNINILFLSSPQNMDVQILPGGDKLSINAGSDFAGILFLSFLAFSSCLFESGIYSFFACARA